MTVGEQFRTLLDETDTFMISSLFTLRSGQSKLVLKLIMLNIIMYHTPPLLTIPLTCSIPVVSMYFLSEWKTVYILRSGGYESSLFSKKGYLRVETVDSDQLVLTEAS